MSSEIFNSNRYIVSDPSHFPSQFFCQQTVDYISEAVTSNLQTKLNQNIKVTDNQIKNVMDSIFEAQPRMGLPYLSQMVVDTIVAHIVNEDAIMNQGKYFKPDSNLYDGTYGTQNFSQGQVPIKKKGPNRFGFHMIY